MLWDWEPVLVQGVLRSLVACKRTYLEGRQGYTIQWCETKTRTQWHDNPTGYIEDVLNTTPQD